MGLLALIAAITIPMGIFVYLFVTDIFGGALVIIGGLSAVAGVVIFWDRQVPPRLYIVINNFIRPN